MAFMESIGKQLSEVGLGVAQQTKNFAEITHLSSAISDAKKKIETVYGEIGRSYFERHQGDPNAEEREQIQHILQLQVEIGQFEEKIDQLKCVTKCATCGADVPISARFCNSCGTAVGTKNKPQRICPVCSEPLGDGHNFCMECGAKVEPAEFTQSFAQIRVCSNCGTMLNQEAVFCPNCGTRAEQESKQQEAASAVRVCSVCQTQVASDDAVCPECGTKLSQMFK